MNLFNAYIHDLAADREELSEAFAKEVTFDDVLEELAELASNKKAYVMQTMDTDRRHFAFQIENLFADAVERIAKRRAREAS